MLVLLVKDTFNILTDLLTQAFPLALSLLAMPSDFVLNGLKRANRLQPAFFIFPFLYVDIVIISMLDSNFCF